MRWQAGDSVSTLEDRSGNRFDRPNTARFFDFDFDPELFDFYDGLDEETSIEGRASAL